MECLEELKKIDIHEISEKTHISILEIEAILRKDYSRFNHTKAVGFTKIFKREYSIDLGEWLEEYEREKGIAEQEEGIFLVSEEKEKSSFRTRLLYIFVAIVVIIAGILLFSAVSFSSFTNTTEQVENQEIIEEAKRKVEENKYLEPKEEETIEEIDETKAEVDEEIIEEEASEIQEEIIKEEKVEEVAVKVEEKKEEVKEEKPAEPKIVLIRSKQNLWIGVRDETNNKNTNRTFKGEYKLDPNNNYTLTFGHGYFDLVNGDEVIKSRLAGIVRYSYKNGEFIKGKYSAPKPKAKPEVKKEEEQAVVPLEKEAVEETN